MSATPFTDPTLVHGVLYANPDRIARRTASLHAAKIQGNDAAGTIISLVSACVRTDPVVLDVGCGRGTITTRLAGALATARVFALDHSPALLATTRARLAEAGHPVQTLCADFHHLPLRDRSIDAAVAAFCLYHSPHPHLAVAEIARCLASGGRAVLVTKSADSYHELDHLLAEAGIDPNAGRRPSLYATFHSGNIEQVTSTALRIERLVHERHVFRFTGLDHVAAYLATSPKHRLPQQLTEEPERLAAQLRDRIADRPVTATSTVSYVAAVRP